MVLNFELYVFLLYKIQHCNICFYNFIDNYFSSSFIRDASCGSPPPSFEVQQSRFANVDQEARSQIFI